MSGPKIAPAGRFNTQSAAVRPLKRLGVPKGACPIPIFGRPILKARTFGNDANSNQTMMPRPPPASVWDHPLTDHHHHHHIDRPQVHTPLGGTGRPRRRSVIWTAFVLIDADASHERRSSTWGAQHTPPTPQHTGRRHHHCRHHHYQHGASARPTTGRSTGPGPSIHHSTPALTLPPLCGRRPRGGHRPGPDARGHHHGGRVAAAHDARGEGGADELRADRLRPRRPGDGALDLI